MGTPVVYPCNVRVKVFTFLVLAIGMQERWEMLHDVQSQTTSYTASDFGYQAIFFRTEADAVVLQLLHLFPDMRRPDARLVDFEDTFCQVQQLLPIVSTFPIKSSEA